MTSLFVDQPNDQLHVIGSLSLLLHHAWHNGQQLNFQLPFVHGIFIQRDAERHMLHYDSL